MRPSLIGSVGALVFVTPLITCTLNVVPIRAEVLPVASWHPLPIVLACKQGAIASMVIVGLIRIGQESKVARQNWKIDPLPATTSNLGTEPSIGAGTFLTSPSVAR